MIDGKYPFKQMSQSAMELLDDRKTRALEPKIEMFLVLTQPQYLGLYLFRTQKAPFIFSVQSCSSTVSA